MELESAFEGLEQKQRSSSFFPSCHCRRLFRALPDTRRACWGRPSLVGSGLNPSVPRWPCAQIPWHGALRTNLWAKQSQGLQLQHSPEYGKFVFSYNLKHDMWDFCICHFGLFQLLQQICSWGSRRMKKKVFASYGASFPKRTSRPCVRSFFWLSTSHEALRITAPGLQEPFGDLQQRRAVPLICSDFPVRDIWVNLRLKVTDNCRIVTEANSTVLRSIFAIHEAGEVFDIRTCFAIGVQVVPFAQEKSPLGEIASSKFLTEYVQQILDDDIYVHQKLGLSQVFQSVSQSLYFRSRVNLQAPFKGTGFSWHRFSASNWRNLHIKAQLEDFEAATTVLIWDDILRFKKHNQDLWKSCEMWCMQWNWMKVFSS